MFHTKTHTTMTTNLINVLQKSFSDKSYQDISQHVDISPASTKNGTKAIIPTVLASILQNNTMSSSAQPSWWNALDNEYPYTDDEFVSTHNISNSTFLVKGREVVSGMFRTNHDDLVSSVSSIAGIQREKAAGLIEVGVPLIVGYLKSWMRKKGWKFKDLIQNLIENKSSITGALPSGISPTQFEVVNKPENKPKNTPKNNFSETIESQIPPVKKPVKKKNNGIMWFVGLVVIALILWYFMGNRACTRNAETDDLIVPGVNDTITSIQQYKKSDGTYYAYEIMPKLALKAENL